MKKPTILGGVTGQAQSHATKGLRRPTSLPDRPRSTTGINGAEQKACAFRPRGRGTGLPSDLCEMLAG
jgi:hypothetical protein